MMNMHLLVTLDMLYSFPKNIDLVQNFGNVRIVIGNNPNYVPDDCPYNEGDHIFIQGEEKDILQWLSTLGKVWIGKGSPMLQEFDLKIFPLDITH